MKAPIILLVLIANLVVSCNTKRNQFASDELNGIYAREYNFEVVHPETGIKVGTRTIRDTIFIKSLGEDYEVSNSKWRLNDYDKDGWQSMEHDEDRPMSRFVARFDAKDNALLEGSTPRIYKINNYLISKRQNQKSAYSKIE